MGSCAARDRLSFGHRFVGRDPASVLLVHRQALAVPRNAAHGLRGDDVDAFLVERNRILDVFPCWEEEVVLSSKVPIEDEEAAVRGDGDVPVVGHRDTKDARDLALYVVRQAINDRYGRHGREGSHPLVAVEGFYEARRIEERVVIAVSIDDAVGARAAVVIVEAEVVEQVGGLKEEPPILLAEATLIDLPAVPVEVFMGRGVGVFQAWIGRERDEVEGFARCIDLCEAVGRSRDHGGVIADLLYDRRRAPGHGNRFRISAGELPTLRGSFDDRRVGLSRIVVGHGVGTICCERIAAGERALFVARIGSDRGRRGREGQADSECERDEAC